MIDSYKINGFFYIENMKNWFILIKKILFIFINFGLILMEEVI